MAVSDAASIFGTLAQQDTQRMQHDQSIAQPQQQATGADQIFAHMAANNGQPPQIAPPATPPPKPETGVFASIKRNTIGAIEGVYHALTDPATDEEKAQILSKIREENARGEQIPEELATNPSRATLALHRILDAPAQELHEKAKHENEVAVDLLKNHQYWRGGNMYLSSLADKALSAVPIAGPAINAAAERMERGDTSGGLTDAALMGLGTKIPEEAGNLVRKVKTPAIVNQVMKGGEVAQAPAKAALGTAARTAGGEATPAIRSMMDKSIANLAKTERATYDMINEAAGTDLKDLYDYRTKLQDAIENPANIDREDLLQEKLKGLDEKITQAESKLKEKIPDKSIEKAKQLTQRRYAQEELKKRLFNNESVVSGNAAHGAEESINVDAAIREVEKLNKPSRYAPEGSPTRLEQALGKDGAQQLLKSLYDAQKAGQKAVKYQDLAGKIAKWIGLGGSALAGGNALAKSFSNR